MLRNAAVLRLLVVALLAEIGYAVLNLSTMQVYLKGDRDFGESVIGFVLVAFLLSEAVFKSPMGHLADKIGPKKLMLIGPAMSVATSLISFVIPHTGGSFGEVAAFMFLRAIDGLGAAMLWPAAFAAMGDATPDSQRQQAMSYLNLCYMLGIALAFPIGGFANDLAHNTYAGLILAACFFGFVALTVWLLVPATPHVVSVVEEHPESSVADFLHSTRQIPSFLLLAIITFMGIGFPMAIFKLFPKEQFGFSETAIGLVILPGAAAMAALSVPMSKLGERIGKTRAVHLGMAICVSGLWIVACPAFIPFLRTPWMFALGGIPVGLGFLMAIPAWMASVSDIDPTRRGSNLGAVMTAQGLGAIIGAPIGASLYEKLRPFGRSIGLGEDFGRYSPFIGCAVCLTIGWIVGMRILREPSVSAPENVGT